MNMLTVLGKILSGFEKSLAWVVIKAGQAAAWLVIPIALAIFLSILLSYFDIGILYEFSENSLFFGDRVTLIGLGELQWHLFGALCFLCFGWGYIADSHVRVDVFTENFSLRTKTILRIFGFFAFMLPFCGTVFYASLNYAMRSYNIGEGSSYDGMQARFVIKSVIPIGFGLLIAAGVIQLIKDINVLLGRKHRS